MTPPPALRNGKSLRCPKCGLPLKIALKDDVEIDTCESCKGVWVDTIEEKKLLQIKPETFTVDELRRLRKAYEPMGRQDPVRYVKCPVCGELMHRKNWGSHSGVIVDRCKEHGTWYDKDELEKVAEFVLSGGVEYEKLKLAEKGNSRLESRLIQEINRLDLKADSVYRRARFFSIIGI